MTIQVRTYARGDCEWVSGRMAHLRVRGASKALCGIETYPGDAIHQRPVLTEAEAREKHQCKSCLKRVEP